MIVYALRALLTALAPLIGAEKQLGHAVPPGWAEDASPETIEGWTSVGMELKGEVERVVQQETSDEYARLLRKVRDPSFRPGAFASSC